MFGSLPLSVFFYNKYNWSYILDCVPVRCKIHRRLLRRFPLSDPKSALSLHQIAPYQILPDSLNDRNFFGSFSILLPVSDITFHLHNVILLEVSSFPAIFVLPELRRHPRISSTQSGFFFHPAVLSSAVHKSLIHNPMFSASPFGMYVCFHRNLPQNIQNYFHYEIRISVLSYSAANRLENIFHPMRRNPDIPTWSPLFRHCCLPVWSQISTLLNFYWKKEQPVLFVLHFYSLR